MTDDIAQKVSLGEPLTPREAALAFSRGYISGGKLGELLGLEPGELHDFKNATHSFCDARQRDHVPPKPVDHYLTVGELRQRISGLTDAAPVYYQRIEDAYFTPGKGWAESVVRKMGEVPFVADDEYIRAFTTVGYRGEDVLYITAHY